MAISSFVCVLIPVIKNESATFEDLSECSRANLFLDLVLAPDGQVGEGDGHGL